MPTITIRRAGAKDVRDIASLHCLSWRDVYRGILDQAFLDGPIEEDRMTLWSKRLGDPSPSQITLLAERDAEPVGFVCAFSDADPQWGSLVDNLHVKPGLRGQGIGEHLLRAAAQAVADQAEAKGLHLWVFEKNGAGLRFYQRLGGKVMERDTSGMAAANNAPALRIFWPDLTLLRA